MYCLGDLVGYAAFPNEVTDRIRREQIPTIMGNYDDGVGFDPGKRAGGLGLRGLEERVRELHGTMSIRSARGAGTTIKIRLPLASRSTEVIRARAAG